MTRIIFIAFALISFSFSANSENYNYWSLGYTKHIAEDPNDSAGTTYYSDPEENGFSIGLGFGNKTDAIAIESEITYFTEVSQKLTSDVTVDVSTLALMENFIFEPDLGSNGYGMIGAGLGVAYTVLDTSYTSGSDTFNKDEDQFTFGYQIILGYGLDNYEIIFKRSEFNEVEGASGTTSGGNSYTSDKFDNVYNSISMRIKF